MTKRHTITDTELNEFMGTHWVRFASSVGETSHKRFEVGFNGLFRVTDHGNEVYVGYDKANAIAAYNEAR